MGWFHNWRLRRAAKAYALRLSPRLVADYGGEGPYTAGQIDAAVRALGLDGRYIALGYAIFLADGEYDRFRSATPGAISASVARDLFERYKGWKPATGGAFTAPPTRWMH